MGKIIGESFDPYVDAQVKIRQKKLGSDYRSNSLLSKITSKNPWLRLTSGVDISLEKANDIGYDKEKNALAKYYQLQGGTLNVSGSIRGGIGGYTDNGFQAYGFDSTPEYGLVPLPSLESFEITPKNNGSLTQADITIKCYNKQQFEKIETLYLRLGYSLLLEWGHSVFTNNEGELVTRGEQLESRKFVSGKFLNPKTDDPLKEVQGALREQREKSDGNYDGLVGRVTNFEWDVTPDGHYTAKVKLTSTGDVIDSLRITPPLPAKPAEGSEEEADIPDYKDIVESTTFGGILKNFKKALDGDLNFKQEQVLGNYQEVSSPNKNRVTFYNGSKLSNENIKDVNELDIGFYNDQQGRANKEIIRVNGKGLGVNLMNIFDSEEPVFNNDLFYYIKFGALLRIIQNFLLIYDPVHKNAPIVNIDWKYEDNQCYIPIQDIYSASPTILLIPSLFTEKREGETVNFKELNNGLGTEFYGEGNNFTFNFMHAHINIDFVMNTLTDNINEENEILLIDFLQALCSGINQSLSNLTQLEPFHDFNDNTLYIVNKCNSDKLLKEKGILKPPTKFRVNGLPQKGPQEGSFVKNISIGSTIPPNFASQIAIGAQANDTEVSSNSTPFSTWNKGLTDRIITEKQTAAGAGESEADRKKRENAAQAKKDAAEDKLAYSAVTGAYYYNRFDFREELLNLESDIKEYFKTQANAAEKASVASSGNEDSVTTPVIIPLSLNLTIDGLSGMKIFQKYTITEDFLPNNYQDSIEFIIKGLSHSISAGGWITKIEGQCIPKFKSAGT